MTAKSATRPLMQTGAQILVDSLITHGANLGFGVPGESYLAVLDAISIELEGSLQLIRVEGHTDDGAITSARFRNNWDLSAARAATVVAYLEQAHQIAPTRMTAAGLGSSHPLVSNDTPENRELNRRIEIVLEVAPQDPRAYLTPAP